MLKTLLTKTLLVVMGRRKEKNGTDDGLEVKQTTAGKNCTLQELEGEFRGVMRFQDDQILSSIICSGLLISR